MTVPKFKVGQKVRWSRPGYTEDGMSGVTARVVPTVWPMRRWDKWMYYPEDPGWLWEQGGYGEAYKAYWFTYPAPERYLLLDGEEASRIIEEEIKQSTKRVCEDLFEDLVSEEVKLQQEEDEGLRGNCKKCKKLYILIEELTTCTYCGDRFCPDCCGYDSEVAPLCYSCVLILDLQERKSRDEEEDHGTQA